NNEQAATVAVAQAMPSRLMTARGAEPVAMEYEAWQVLLRSVCGRYSPEGVEPDAFAGWVRPLNVWGFPAVDVGCNARRVERTSRDTRLDGMEHYYALVQ